MRFPQFCFLNMWNIHRMFITHKYIEHRNPETQKYLRLLSSGTKLFITFEFKGFSTYGERDTIFLCWLFCLPPHHHHVRPRKPTVFFRGWTQLTDFSQISAHASGSWRHLHPWSHPLSGIFIVTSLNDTSKEKNDDTVRFSILEV